MEGEDKCPHCTLSWCKSSRNPRHLSKLNFLLDHCDCPVSDPDTIAQGGHDNVQSIDANKGAISLPAASARNTTSLENTTLHTTSSPPHINTYNCHRCNSKFSSRSKYQSHHRRAHHKNYECPVCHKSFHKTNYLTTHIRTKALFDVKHRVHAVEQEMNMTVLRCERLKCQYMTVRDYDMRSPSEVFKMSHIINEKRG